jgi:hypothetical protein
MGSGLNFSSIQALLRGGVFSLPVSIVLFSGSVPFLEVFSRLRILLDVFPSGLLLSTIHSTCRDKKLRLPALNADALLHPGIAFRLYGYA